MKRSLFDIHAKSYAQNQQLDRLGMTDDHLIKKVTDILAFFHIPVFSPCSCDLGTEDSQLGTADKDIFTIFLKKNRHVPLIVVPQVVSHHWTWLLVEPNTHTAYEFDPSLTHNPITGACNFDCGQQSEKFFSDNAARLAKWPTHAQPVFLNSLRRPNPNATLKNIGSINLLLNRLPKSSPIQNIVPTHVVNPVGTTTAVGGIDRGYDSQLEEVLHRSSAETSPLEAAFFYFAETTLQLTDLRKEIQTLVSKKNKLENTTLLEIIKKIDSLDIENIQKKFSDLQIAFKNLLPEDRETAIERLKQSKLYTGNLTEKNYFSGAKLDQESYLFGIDLEKSLNSSHPVTLSKDAIKKKFSSLLLATHTQNSHTLFYPGSCHIADKKQGEKKDLGASKALKVPHPGC